jgi:hypothetical protein
MVNWKQTVKIGDLHQAHEDKKLSTQELCLKVAERMKKLVYYVDSEEFQSFVSELEDMGAEEDVDPDDYDCVLSLFYDWGDYQHRLWIDTFDLPARSFGALTPTKEES